MLQFRSSGFPLLVVAAAAPLAFASPASGALIEDFEDGTADGFAVADANGDSSTRDAVFEVVTEGSNNVYSQTNSDLANRNTLTGDGKPGGYSIAPGTFSGLDATLRVRVDDANGFGDAALLFGFQDNDNNYLVVFNENAANNQVFILENNVRTPIGPSFDGNGAAAGSGAVAGTFYDVMLLHDPTLGNVSLSIGGVEVYNQTDPRFTTFASGGFAIGAINDAASFDDLGVDSIPEPATAAAWGVLCIAGLRRRSRSV